MFNLTAYIQRKTRLNVNLSDIIDKYKDIELEEKDYNYESFDSMFYKIVFKS